MAEWRAEFGSEGDALPWFTAIVGFRKGLTLPAVAISGPKYGIIHGHNDKTA